MKDLLFLIGFLSLVAIPVGVLMLLFKTQRKRGLKTIAGAVLAFVVYAVGLSQYPDENAGVTSIEPEKQRSNLARFMHELSGFLDCNTGTCGAVASVSPRLNWDLVARV